MDDDIAEDNGEIDEAEVEESGLIDGPDSTIFCFSTVMGLCPPNSMKVKGKIKNKEVVVLIDSGATHNFILEDLATSLGLQMVATREYTVQMGNGDEAKTTGLYKDLRLKLEGLEVTDNFFPLKLGSTDAILGFQWLSTLGDAVMNWGKLSLFVNIGGVRLRDPALSHSQTPLNSMLRMILEERHGILLELCQMKMEANDVGSTEEKKDIRATGLLVTIILRYI